MQQFCKDAADWLHVSQRKHVFAFTLLSWLVGRRLPRPYKRGNVKWQLEEQGIGFLVVRPWLVRVIERSKYTVHGCSRCLFYFVYPFFLSLLFKQRRTRFAPWWTPTPRMTASYRNWWRWGRGAAGKVLGPTGLRVSLFNADVSLRCLSTGSTTCWSVRGSLLRTWRRICMMDRFCRSSLVRILGSVTQCCSPRRSAPCPSD